MDARYAWMDDALLYNTLAFVFYNQIEADLSRGGSTVNIYVENDLEIYALWCTGGKASVLPGGDVSLCALLFYSQVK